MIRKGTRRRGGTLGGREKVDPLSFSPNPLGRDEAQKKRGNDRSRRDSAKFASGDEENYHAAHKREGAFVRADVSGFRRSLCVHRVVSEVCSLRCAPSEVCSR